MHDLTTRLARTRRQVAQQRRQLEDLHPGLEATRQRCAFDRAVLHGLLLGRGLIPVAAARCTATARCLEQDETVSL